MLRRIINSHLLFCAILAVPAMLMLWQFFFRFHSWGLLARPVGRVGRSPADRHARGVAAPAADEAVGLGPHWPMWLLKRRRDLGLAAFLYAALHLAIYVVRTSPTSTSCSSTCDTSNTAMGWLAFAHHAGAGSDQQRPSVHGSGAGGSRCSALPMSRRWPRPCTGSGSGSTTRPSGCTSCRWRLLEAYRLLYNFARPAGVKH